MPVSSFCRKHLWAVNPTKEDSPEKRGDSAGSGEQHAHSRGCTAQRIQFRTRTAGSGFSVSNDNAAGKSAAPQAAGGINGIDALLALQGVEDAVERRRRFAKRGAKALDMLDALKVQIIEGRIDMASLTRLEGMLNELTERSGEDQLDGVLDAIGLRVAVEIAKRRPRLAASRLAGLRIETGDLG